MDVLTDRLVRMVRGVLGLVLAVAAVAACTPGGSGSTRPAGPRAAGTPPAGTVVEALPDDRCAREERFVERTVTSGARWRFCWNVDPTLGLVLHDLAYAPPGKPYLEVLAEAHLAEVYMVYDTGTPRGHDTDTGFGTLKPLAPAECPDGTVYASAQTFGKGALCVTVGRAGYSYVQADGDDHLLGTELTVLAVARVEWYTYITRWTLRDDGSIGASLGASGTLRPDSVADRDPAHGSPLGPGQTRFHTAHFHNATWRLAFPRRTSGYRVEQVDVDRRPDDTYTVRRTPRPREFAASFSGARTWRVTAAGVLNADGHPATWELPSQAGAGFTSTLPGERFLLRDVHLTEYDDCQLSVHTISRPGRSCPDATLDRYPDGQPVTRPVLWATIGFHHIPRDEDADPMPVHWQGFTLHSRDLQAHNATTER